MAGEVRSPAAEHLGLRLVRWARGVAVYEMPVGASACDRLGRVENGALRALAEAAMTAAARTLVADGDERPDAMCTRGLSAEFWRPVALAEAETLRAEAIVMRRDGVTARSRPTCCAEVPGWPPLPPRACPRAPTPRGRAPT